MGQDGSRSLKKRSTKGPTQTPLGSESAAFSASAPKELGTANPTELGGFPPSTQPHNSSGLAKLRQFLSLQLGLVLVLSSTIGLSIHNVLIKLLIDSPIKIPGWPVLGGWVQPSLGNLLFILWLRMLVVVPLMTLSAGMLYPAAWRDIRSLVLGADRRSLWTVVASGSCLFTSQILLYLAIAHIGPGIAVTLLFLYPVVITPLTWWLFRDRPTALRFGILGMILLGAFLVVSPIPKIMPSTPQVFFLGQGKTLPTQAGVLMAGLASIAFAVYLILMQIGFRKLHPVPVSMMQFVILLVLSSLSLMLPIDLGVAIAPQNRAGFFLGGGMLGVLTIVSYLTNHWGVRYLGAARSAIVAPLGPGITVILAAICLSQQPTEIQLWGIGGVTIGMIALSLERISQQHSQSAQASHPRTAAKTKPT